MLPARDIGLAVGTFAINDWHFDNLEAHARRPENEVEIAKWVEISEEGPARVQPLVIAAAKNLGSAQRILVALAEHEREGEREELVAQKVEKSHRFLFHGIDKAGAVDEFALA